ncbi:3-phosphoshikimate 1-carboxyvinyltransferase, partial [Desulfobulbus sp. F4]|nr:3-phosphoshikimate 1-carboxyvinyltransferase [Desulfobulbus sp. F4]
MIEITPVHSLDAVVRVPGSKSLTQRALIASALAEGEPVLLGPLASEDTRYTMTALRQMGIAIDDSDPAAWQVRGCGGGIQTPAEDIFLGNN